MLEQRELTEAIIGMAIDVHRALGPGPLESVYKEGLCHELPSAKLPLHREVSVPVKYKGIDLPPGFRADIIVDSAVLVEVKAVPNLTASPEAQLRTYLRLNGIRLGLLLNFHEQALKAGLKRFIV